MKFDFKPVLLSALLAGVALTAQAQNDAAPQAPPQAPPQDTRGSAMPGDGAAVQPRRDDGTRMQRRTERMQVRIAQRMAALKVKLKLDQAQEGAWDAFARSMQPTPEQLQRMMSLRSQMRSLPTPERIDRLRALRAERDAAMDQRFDATKAFYAQLSPGQQKTFDENAMRWGGGRGGRDHDRRDRGHHHDGMGMEHGERHGG